METDQAECLNVLFNQCVKLLNKNHNTKETDASTNSKRDKRSLSHFDNQDIQRKIVMSEKTDTSLTISGQQLEITGMSKSIIQPQKVACCDLEIPEDYLEKRSMSLRQEGFNPHLAMGVYSLKYCYSYSYVWYSRLFTPW